MKQILPVVVLAGLVLVAALNGGLDARVPHEAIGIYLGQSEEGVVVLKLDGTETELWLASGTAVPALRQHQNVLISYSLQGLTLQLKSISALPQPRGSEILAVEEQAAQYMGTLAEGVVELVVQNKSQLIPIAEQHLAFVVWPELSSSLDLSKLAPGTQLLISYHFNHQGDLVLVDAKIAAGR